PGDDNDGDWFINPAQGLGISGNYGGIVPDGSWNRLALVVDNVAGTFTSFLNGLQVQQNTGLTLDRPWAPEATPTLLSDEDQENSAGLVNCVQLRSEALSAADLAELGGPSAGGISIPAAPTLRIISPNGGESFQAGSTQTVSWASANPNGLMQVDLYRDA